MHRSNAMTQPTTNPTSPTSAPSGRPQGAGGAGPEIQRQFVSFAFFRIDPSIRQLPDQEKWGARSEFLKQFQTPWKAMISLSYSTMGLKADCDFLLWRISSSPDSF